MKKTLTVRELSVISIFTALTAVLAQIAIPLPFTPVPISFGLVAVYITGILLKPKHAILTQLCYLLLGAVGVPVFGGFRGGMAALFGPTGGYLMVYPIMAGIVAAALNSRKSLEAETRQNKGRRFLKAAVSIFIAHMVIYLGGTAWLSVTSGNSFQASLALGVYPYIPLDIAKIVFCVTVIVPLRFRFRSMNLLMLKSVPNGTATSGAQVQ